MPSPSWLDRVDSIMSARGFVRVGYRHPIIWYQPDDPTVLDEYLDPFVFDVSQGVTAAAFVRGGLSLAEAAIVALWL